jgi:hypothetical protein
MTSQTPPVAAPVVTPPVELVLISHSPLFYWWPVWVVGFLVAALSYLEGHQIAFVPPGTVAMRDQTIVGLEGRRDVLITPEGQPLPIETETEELKQPQRRMAASNNLGILWVMTLCLVILITHVKLRGMSSVVAVVVIVFTTVVLALLGLWDPIFRAVRIFDIHITAFGYVSISLFLFVLWLTTFLLFDRLAYMVFSRGQLRVRLAVGEGETVFDTRGMVVEKHKDDLFRHWLLGFGAGDLTVRTAGPALKQFEMPNILFVGKKLAMIHTMLQEREVVRGSR